MKRQDEVFLREREGDAWYTRNMLRLKNRSTLLSRYVSRLPLKGKRVLEIGCSNGYLLAPLARRGARTYGVDPSGKAIAEGKREFRGVHFVNGVSHDLRFSQSSFDIVLISFVLHWVDRSRLLQTVYEIDRVLKSGGTLIIQDFDPDLPHKVRYKHRMDRAMYTYKQRYADIFLASAGYKKLKEIPFLHQDPHTERNIRPRNENSCSIVVLRKSGSEAYSERSLPVR